MLALASWSLIASALSLGVASGVACSRIFTLRNNDKQRVSLMSSALHHLPIIYWQTDDMLRLSSVEGAERNPLSGSLHESLGIPIEDVFPLTHRDELRRLHEAALRGEVSHREITCFDHLQRITIEPLRDTTQRIIGTCGSAFICDEIQDLREKLLRERHIDELTGLATRIRCYDRLAQALHITARNKKKVGVLFVDIDRFRMMNDANGSTIGDALLRAVAQRLQRVVRRADTVARIQSDEFAIVIVDIGGADGAAIVAQKILEAFHEPFEIEGLSLFITVSIGIALSPFDGNNEGLLLGNAETASVSAKLKGGNCFYFYTADMHHHIADRLALEGALRAALSTKNSEIEVYYQPMIGRTGSIIALEALVRWQHPTMGFLAPDKFIPLAEETGLIVQLGEEVLRIACRDLSDITEAYGGPIQMSINLSPRQFDDEQLLQKIRNIFDESPHINHSLIELELTESTLMRDMERAIVILQELRSTGMHIAIDDFGTGYSSLAYLKKLPIDTLKIDRSFVRELPSDHHATAIISAVSTLAKALKLEVVAEGVETPEQMVKLLEVGCDRLQGYLFSRPVPLATLLPLLRKPQLAMLEEFALAQSPLDPMP